MSYPSTGKQWVYSTAPADWATGHLRGGILPLYIEEVGVFYSPSQLCYRTYIARGGVIPLCREEVGVFYKLGNYKNEVDAKVDKKKSNIFINQISKKFQTNTYTLISHKMQKYLFKYYGFLSFLFAQKLTLFLGWKSLDFPYIGHLNIHGTYVTDNI